MQVVAGFCAHLANHVEEVDVTVDGEDGGAHELVFFVALIESCEELVVRIVSVVLWVSVLCNVCGHPNLLSLLDVLIHSKLPSLMNRFQAKRILGKLLVFFDVENACSDHRLTICLELTRLMRPACVLAYLPSCVALDTLAKRRSILSISEVGRAHGLSERGEFSVEARLQR